MSQPAIRLYRDLLRKVRLLPRSSKEYYRVHVRQNYVAHEDESDTQRIKEIISKAKQDAEWVLKKSDALAAGERTSRAKPHRASSKLGKASNYVLPPIYLGLWMTASSALIFMNKRLMVDDGFNFPLALTGAGQTASFLLSLLVAKSGLMPLREAPTVQFFLIRLLPVVVCSAGTLFLGNAAYLHLSVAFIQILKAATPALTLTTCAIMGLEKASKPLILSVGMIVVGTGLATLIESGAAGFSWLGLGYFTLSAILEAVRVVYIQLLLASLNYNAVEVIVWLAPLTAVFLLAASWLFEYERLTEKGFAMILARPLKYLCAVLMGFAVNMTTALAIKASSGLTYKVLGCVKNTAVVLGGVFLGDELDSLQMLGYGISLIGFAIFSRAKWLDSRRDVRQKQEKRKL